MKRMLRIAKKLPACAAIFGAGAILTGCVYPQAHLSDDFGRAVRQNVAAQVADPDAAYKGLPAPGAFGTRAGLAQDRYHTGDVISPASTSTSSVTVGGGGK
jgi:type IV pilus biogenesis protein CpaD/CtpE